MTLAELERACAIYRSSGFRDDALICALVNPDADPTMHAGRPLLNLQIYSTAQTLASSVAAAAAAANCPCGHPGAEHDTAGCIPCDAAWIQSGQPRCPTRTPPPAAGGGRGRADEPESRRRGQPAARVGG